MADVQSLFIRLILKLGCQGCHSCCCLDSGSLFMFLTGLAIALLICARDQG